MKRWMPSLVLLLAFLIAARRGATAYPIFG